MEFGDGGESIESVRGTIRPCNAFTISVTFYCNRVAFTPSTHTFPLNSSVSVHLLFSQIKYSFSLSSLVG